MRVGARSPIQVRRVARDDVVVMSFVIGCDGDQTPPAGSSDAACESPTMLTPSTRAALRAKLSAAQDLPGALVLWGSFTSC